MQSVGGLHATTPEYTGTTQPNQEITERFPRIYENPAHGKIVWKRDKSAS